MSETSPSALPEIDELRRAKADRLAELTQKKPGQKHYKRVLRSFLEADDALERAMERRVLN